MGIAGLGLIILPWLSKAMPPDEFGLAATILSLQSLAIVLDLGLSITVSRELPAMDSSTERLEVIWRCERTLFILYGIVTSFALLLAILQILATPVSTVLLIGMSMLIVVWQNIIVIAFLSQQQFLTSTIVQLASLLSRLGTGLAFVIFGTSTLEMFVLGQVVGSVIVLALSRFFLAWKNRPDGREHLTRQIPLATNVVIAVYTIAGASALQLDKLVLSGVSSPASTGPYFLASIFSLVPITFLASPLSQFVQPKLIASLVQNRDQQAQRWIIRLTLGIFTLAVLPGIAMGLAANFIVPLWLHGSPHEVNVIRYVMLLMPGASIGALGLVPAIVLIARRDYFALAVISCFLTGGILIATAALAYRNSIEGICLAYSAYHTTAAIVLWWRAWRIEPQFSNSFGFLMGGATGRR